jgi:diguanylate cyclase (GGDEF)-like protein
VKFAQVLKQASRSSDILARMGGDEFVVVLLDTDHAGAEQYSSKLRDLSLQRQRTVSIDFSMGIRIFNHFT